MLVQKSKAAAIVIAACGLAACAGEPTCNYSKAPYMAASSVPALRAPDGLSTPDRSNTLIVPAPPANAPPPPTGKSKCLDRPPSYFSTAPQANQTVPEKK